MSELSTKIKSWFGNLNKSKVSFERAGVKPARDWNILIFIVFLTLLIIGGMAFYFYVEVDNGTFFDVTDSEELSEAKINDQLLKKIIDDINTRENELAEIRESKDFPPNPSL